MVPLTCQSLKNEWERMQSELSAECGSQWDPESRLDVLVYDLRQTRTKHWDTARDVLRGGKGSL